MAPNQPGSMVLPPGVPERNRRGAAGTPNENAPGTIAFSSPILNDSQTVPVKEDPTNSPGVAYIDGPGNGGERRFIDIPRSKHHRHHLLHPTPSLPASDFIAVGNAEYSTLKSTTYSPITGSAQTSAETGALHRVLTWRVPALDPTSELKDMSRSAVAPTQPTSRITADPASRTPKPCSDATVRLRPTYDKSSPY